MKKPKLNKAKLRKAALIATITIVFVLAVFGIYSFVFSSKVYPRTFIGDKNLAGMKKDAALAYIKATSDTALATNLVLKNPETGKEFTIAPVEISLTFDHSATVDQAWKIGRNKNVFRAMCEQLRAVFARKNVEAVYSYNQDALRTKIAAIASGLDQPERDYALAYQGGKFILLTERNSGKRIDQNEIILTIESQFEKIKLSNFDLALKSYSPQISEQSANEALANANKILDAGGMTLKSDTASYSLDRDTIASFVNSAGDGTKMILVINSAKIDAYLASLAGKINVAPADAKLTITNGKVSVFQASQVGKELDQTQAKTDLSAAIFARYDGNDKKIDTANVQLKVASTTPAVASDAISQYGLNEVIGTGTTDFSGSPSNRIANITTGVSKINGYLVKPGEEFSTVKALSPIDQAHGYVAGLVISGGKTFPADGGGLCQVSTTLFRAVLNAGLTVTARSAHSYEVSYYQRGVGPGLDATIFDPNPDFKWTNNTGHYIFIQGVIKGKTLTFTLYGTSDGRVAKIDGPTTLSTSQPSGDPIYVQSDTIAPGEIHQIDPPVPGAKTTVIYTVTRGGIVINKQTFNSDYKAMPAQYLYGVGAVLPGQVAPAVVETPPPTCTDGTKNGDETGVDCGGSCPTACTAT